MPIWNHTTLRDINDPVGGREHIQKLLSFRMCRLERYSFDFSNASQPWAAVTLGGNSFIRRARDTLLGIPQGVYGADVNPNSPDA